MQSSDIRWLTLNHPPLLWPWCLDEVPGEANGMIFNLSGCDQFGQAPFLNRNPANEKPMHKLSLSSAQDSTQSLVVTVGVGIWSVVHTYQLTKSSLCSACSIHQAHRSKIWPGWTRLFPLRGLPVLWDSWTHTGEGNWEWAREVGHGEWDDLCISCTSTRSPSMAIWRLTGICCLNLNSVVETPI